MLQCGEKQNVTFAFHERDLSLYRVDNGGWERPVGIEVHLGASSADIRQVMVISRAIRWSGSGPLCMAWHVMVVAAFLFLHW